MISVVDYGWYWGNGAKVDEAVAGAIEWYNKEHKRQANFVQLCGEDERELGLNGRLRGVTVFQRNGERGNIMVGRMERV